MKLLVLIAALFASSAVCATPLDDYLQCTSGPIQNFSEAMNKASILYPRFGIAWSEQASAMAATKDAAAVHQKFVDRMLKTAEPEAIEFYNLMKMKINSAIATCGPMPGAQQ